MRYNRHTRRYEEDLRIEYPSRGATYHRNEFGVYRYDEYPRHSVLAGQVRRTFVDRFLTLEEARAAYPSGRFVTGSGYAPPSLNHLSDDGDY